MAYRAIIVGVGSFGEVWCRNFLPPNVEDGLVEVVAAVGHHKERLETAMKYLNIPKEKCYYDAETAFRETPADFCIIVTNPDHHEEIVDLAVKYHLHILSEKPIAESLEAAIRISEKVKRAGLKMGITMSHRFDQDKTTLREELRSGKWGNIDYIMTRFTCDCRKYASWGEFRYKMQDPLMLEGAVHHLDILADFAGAKCDTIYSESWCPSWGTFAGDCNALVTMKFENGVRAVYEGAKTNAVTLNWWSHEYFRAECEKGTLVLNQRALEVFPYDETQEIRQANEGEGEKLRLIEQKKWSNAWLVEKFVRWLSGGEAMETDVASNLQSMALIFAAIKSARTGMPVKVQELLEETREKVLSSM